MNTYDLGGRTAVVTGGASGLGLEIAERLLAAGANVSIWDMNDAALDQAAQVLEGNAAEEGMVDARSVDVTDYASVARAARQVDERFGRIDLLVNNAGVSGPFLPCHEYPLDAWSRQLAVNLTGVFHGCRAVIPFMLKRGYGRIVNVASTSGKEGNPLSSGYAASKAGVIGLTKTLGKELATTGIIVNCVTPALLDTPMHEASLKRMPADMMASLKAKIPMQRIGKPIEVANMIAWMLSEDCSFTTGSSFDLSGGRSTY